MAAILLVADAASTQAQSGKFRTTIPFPFTVGDSELEPGTYAFHRRGPTLLELDDEKGHRIQVLVRMTQFDPVFAQGQLLFMNYGSERFLYQIRWPQEALGIEILAGKRQTQLSKTVNPKQRLSVEGTRN